MLPAGVGPSPEIPFWDADWSRSLLDRGDVAGAIAKARRAAAGMDLSAADRAELARAQATGDSTPRP